MQKGRLMELVGCQNCDPAIPLQTLQTMLDLKIDRPAFWYAWSYEDAPCFGKPVNLAALFFHLLDETKITVNDDCEVTILDLVETLLAHPENVTVQVR